MKKIRLSALLLALVMITSCMVGGTFAKYTSSAAGDDTATVAKWSFTVGGKEIANETPQTITFDLFKTINDTGNTADEGDVADAKIAPGTAGSFKLALTNTSEVNAKYTIALGETNSGNVPLQYSVNGTDWEDSIDDLVMTALTNQAIAMNGTATQTVHWRWVFEGAGHAGQTDITDTALGIAAQTAAPQVLISATVTATQVD